MTNFNPLKYVNKLIAENKFKEGDVVYALEDPSLKLIIRRYVDKIYYCTVQKDPGSKDRVYFERELTDEAVK